MGFTENDSVTNRCGQMWGVPNLFVADGSLFPTSGGYNPTHTIEALAHWVANCIVEQGAAILQRGRSSPNTSTTGPAGVLPLAAAAAGAAAALKARKPRAKTDADA